MFSKSFVAYACLFGFTASINAQAAVLGSERSLVQDEVQRSLHASYLARRASSSSEAPVFQSSVEDFEDVKASLVDSFTATPLPIPRDVTFLSNVIGGHGGPVPFPPPNDDDSPSQEATAQITSQYQTALPPPPPPTTVNLDPPTPPGGAGAALIGAAAPQTTSLIVAQIRAVDPLPTPRDDIPGFPGHIIGGHNDNNAPFLPPDIIDPFPSQDNLPPTPTPTTVNLDPPTPAPSGGLGGAAITAATPQATVLVVGRDRAAPQVRAAVARAANTNRRSANSERTWSSRRPVNLS